MLNRLKSVFDFLNFTNTDAALIFSGENRRYYSDFDGSTGYCVCLSNGQAFFLADSRYILQATQQCTGFIAEPISGEKSIYDFFKKHNVSKLAVETQFITWDYANALISNTDIEELISIDEITRSDRIIKDEAEINYLKKAAHYADEAFSYIVGIINEGMTELQINFELQTFLRRFDDVEGTMNRYIVASGPRSALPHGLATSRKIQKGDFVTMDYGCCVGGYWSDIARTICIGKASTKQKEIYDAVREAHRVGMKALKPGITGKQVDAAARAVIEDGGFGKYFTHGLGHGLGLTVSELPRLTQAPEGELILKPGMVATVEPGIYIENFGGVRIENDMLITETGSQSMTNSTTELIEI